MGKIVNRFKTFKSDAAPFFFFIDIFPPKPVLRNSSYLRVLLNAIENNPIMPLPMRIDRVINGISSILIRPREAIYVKISSNEIAILNPLQFIFYGINKLLYFTEIRIWENLLRSLDPIKTVSWWNKTRFLYGNLYQLEDDFSTFLKAYLRNIIKALINEDDLIKAAIKYCQLIVDICQERFDENKIFTNVGNNENFESLYKLKEITYYKKFKKFKEKQIHPELIDIEIFDTFGTKNFEDFKIKNNISKTEVKLRVKKYIPLMFYDDLQECMLMNLKKLEIGVENLLDPNFLTKHKIILLKDNSEITPKEIKKFNWFNNFEDINIDSIITQILEKKNLIK
ncbi:MAG: hypothetical protein ACP6IY_21780 [Promethearchaeia archaeon]